MKSNTIAKGYDVWIRSIKERVQQARFKALMMANAEQILLYWDVGHEILEKQNAEGWGSKIVERMSVDLKTAFPDMKGWSRSNLMYMRQFAEAWRRDEIVQAPLGQLPWYHHLTLSPSTRWLISTNRLGFRPISSAFRRPNSFKPSCRRFLRHPRGMAVHEESREYAIMYAVGRDDG